MNASTRRFALRAATKATMTLTLLGCGGVALTASSSDAGLESATKDSATGPEIFAEASTTPEAESASHSPDAEITCTTSGVDSDAEISESTFECCTGLLDGVVGDSGFVEFFSDATVARADVLPCCRVIMDRLRQDEADADAVSDAAASDFDAVGRIRIPCCNAIDRGCEGWGPPVPPEMGAPVGSATRQLAV
jgi:hypothetical protein